MRKKKESYGKPCGLLPGDVVLCWNIAPHRFYEVKSTEPRLGDNDIVYLTFIGGTSSAPLYTLEKNLMLDASHVVKVTAENIAMHVRKLANDMNILLSALEKQQDLEKERKECLLQQVKPKSKSSVKK
jgi:hypothetical protein